MFDKILMHLLIMHIFYGGVGEVVNTLVCGTSIRGFDSHTPPHLKITYGLIIVCKFLFYIELT